MNSAPISPNHGFPNFVKNFFARLYFGIISAWVWLVFILVVATSGIFLYLAEPLLLKKDQNGKIAHRLIFLCAKIILFLNPLWKVTWVNREKLLANGPFIITPNHTSLADAIVMALLPLHAKWITKAEMLRVPFVGIMMRLAGHIATLRGDSESGMKSIEKSGEWLTKGVSILIFPEGTRSRDGVLGRFKSGAARLALLTNRPLLPVSIHGAFDSIRADSWIFKRAHITVKIGEPIPVDETMKPALLNHQLRERVLHMLALPANGIGSQS
jgi:1-acyl-sn-glycerol-3-phosphate acyltransferase